MLPKENRLKTTAVAFTAVALLFFIFHQYQSYQTDEKNTQQQLLLNTLHGRIIYLDEALTMSARLYILTGEKEWVQRHIKLQPQFNATISQVYELHSGNFHSKSEIESAAEKLMNFEIRAFELAHLKRLSEARAILFGEEYRQQQALYSAGLAKLRANMEVQLNALKLSRRNEVLENTLVTGVIILLILFGWYLFTRISRKWRNKIIEVERKRVEEAVAAEKMLQKANDQLRLLSTHLQKVREKERLNLAYDINEEVGQQLAAIKLRLTTLQKDISFAEQNQAAEYQEIVAQFRELLSFLRNLASNTYPLVLRDLGLIEALEWESKRVAELFKMTIVFSSDVDYLKLDKHVLITIFRIYQEKINILAANGATEIFALLQTEDERLGLSIYDDLHKDTTSRLIEEVAIEERLRSIKGTFEANSSEEGNQFVVFIPYHEKEKEQELLYW